MREGVWPPPSDRPPLQTHAIVPSDFGTLSQGAPLTIDFSKFVAFDTEGQLAGNRRIYMAAIAQYDDVFGNGPYELMQHVSIRNMPDALHRFWKQGGGSLQLIEDHLSQWYVAT